MSKKAKRILEIILISLALALVVFAVVKITSVKTKNVSSFSYSIGALDEDTGEYVENKQAIYTKNAIECRGLSIRPDFEANVEYQIFWYGVGDCYFGCTELFDSNEKFYSNDVPELAKYCRIVIYPSQYESDGNLIEDFKVRFWEKSSYANDLRVTVNKKQDMRLEDLYQTAKKNINNNVGMSKPELDSEYTYFYPLRLLHTFDQSWQEMGIQSTSSTMSAVIKIDCSDTVKYNFYFNRSVHEFYDIIFFDENGKYMGHNNLRVNSQDDFQYEVYVPSDAKYMIIESPYSDNNKEIPFIINKTVPRNDITEALYANK